MKATPALNRPVANAPDAKLEQAATAGGPKQRLLRAVIDYVREYGLEGLSLRQLSTAIGSRHRMLLYHFGSKEGLLVEVVNAVEEDLSRALMSFDAGPSLSPADVLRRFWALQTRPDMVPLARLWVEVFAHALRDKTRSTSFFQAFDKPWMDAFCKVATSAGAARADTKIDARLALAVMRGLYLDLLATGDRRGVSKAVARFSALYASGAKATTSGKASDESTS
jgi:AcrR family transcriptional regulator